VKRTRRDEPIGVTTHICMERTQGNSLCRYLYLKLEKCHVSLFIFYIFSSTKSENRFFPGLYGTGGKGKVARIGVGRLIQPK
jgi:hypothetical protein